MDLISLLGYSKNSPYAGNPYLDIHTPEGLIDMSNTPMDLIGIDNKGNKKKMKAGRKNPYKFEGDMVREIPMQEGGILLPDMQQGGRAPIIINNPYQEGGLTKESILSFLFDDKEDTEETPVKKVENTAPSADDISPEDNEQDNLAMEQAMMSDNPADTGFGNPYNGTSNSLSRYGQEFQNIDQKVAMATEEMLQKYPNLRLTSGYRTWGDKDAHPKRRAVDISYHKDAYDYYQNVIVPKYGFNPALKPNHGTGLHIHLGYY